MRVQRGEDPHSLFGAVTVAKSRWSCLVPHCQAASSGASATPWASFAAMRKHVETPQAMVRGPKYRLCASEGGGKEGRRGGGEGSTSVLSLGMPPFQHPA